MKDIACKSIYNYRIVKYFILSICVLSSTFYLVLEWEHTGLINDSIFIGMILGATVILIQGLIGITKYIDVNGITFFINMYEGLDIYEVQKNYQSDLNAIFNKKYSALFGLMFSLTFAFAIWYLKVWAEDTLLRMLFISFLIFVNFCTGTAIYALSRFFKICYNWSSNIKIEFWQKETETIIFIRKLRNKVLTSMSVYISLCLSSILFSNIKINSLFFLYTFFSVILVSLAYFIPEIPIKTKTSKIKDKMIRDINHQVSVEYKNAFDIAKESGNEIDLTRLNALFDMKDKIEQVAISKINKTNLVSLLSFIFITALPVFVQILLERVVS